MLSVFSDTFELGMNLFKQNVSLKSPTKNLNERIYTTTQIKSDVLTSSEALKTLSPRGMVKKDFKYVEPRRPENTVQINTDEYYIKRNDIAEQCEQIHRNTNKKYLIKGTNKPIFNSFKVLEKLVENLKLKLAKYSDMKKIRKSQTAFGTRKEVNGNSKLFILISSVSLTIYDLKGLNDQNPEIKTQLIPNIETSESSISVSGNNGVNQQDEVRKLKWKLKNNNFDLEKIEEIERNQLSMEIFEKEKLKRRRTFHTNSTTNRKILQYDEKKEENDEEKSNEKFIPLKTIKLHFKMLPTRQNKNDALIRDREKVKSKIDFKIMLV